MNAMNSIPPLQSRDSNGPGAAARPSTASTPVPGENSVVGFRLSDFRRISAFGLRIFFPLAACISLTGCFGLLKPAKSIDRRFVLSPLSAPSEPKVNPAAPVLGVGRVQLPGYLLNTSMAVRKGSNEVEYLPTVLWAERLDSGIQRVVAANLATLLATDQIRLSSWSNREVNAELYIAVERLDLDTDGRGTLVARWRILSPGGEKLLRAGEGRFTHQGASPGSDPAAAVATLSGLVEDLSRQLASAIQDAARGQPPVSK